jgi:hypothetical protein
MLMTGKKYLQSIRDGRVIYASKERIEDQVVRSLPLKGRAIACGATQAVRSLPLKGGGSPAVAKAMAGLHTRPPKRRRVGVGVRLCGCI